MFTKMIDFKHKIFNRYFILLAIIIILIVVAIVLFFIFKKQKQEPAKLVTFSDANSELSISIYDNYGFEKQEDDSRLLYLKSNTSGDIICISKFSTTNIRDIKKFIEADKDNYISNFSNISDVSDIKEYNSKVFPTYNYHFNYKENMYVDVYWILKDSNLYVIDFNINKNTDDLFSKINEILDSLKFNK